jgi:histidinol dehydrogenase
MIEVIKYKGSKSIEKLLLKPQPHRMDEVSETVRLIINEIDEMGDKAVASYTTTFDGVSLQPEDFELTQPQIEAHLERVDEKLLEAIETAANRIESYHRRQLEKSFDYEDIEGIRLGQRVRPLDRVGIYVPGGKAIYPSTVLMNAIPAKVAGVNEVIMVSPPSNSGLPPAIVAAAKVAGVDRIFRIGGAQAIAALAMGTARVPGVNKIVGPGNRYVAEAKRQLFGVVDIDMFAGPSEVLIVADSSADALFLTMDMMAQAEHDEDARSILLCTSKKIIEEVKALLKKEVAKSPRKDIIRKALSAGSAIVLIDNMQQAAEIANEIAAEHVELAVREPEELFDKIDNAGSVFLGHYTPVTCGDYIAGPNHVLPTMGTARFFSPLGVYDFINRVGYMKFGQSQLEKFADTTMLLAETEGLSAHARSIAVRLKGK